MAWRCPACELPISHTDFEERPRPGARYRCHVCRLDLILDLDTNKLTVPQVAESESDADEDGPAPKSTIR